MNTVYMSTELYCAGQTEDGHEYSAERYLVWVEAPNGARLEHVTRFPGCTVERNEEDGYMAFIDNREQAAADCQVLVSRVQGHINMGGKLNMEFWVEIDPAYGSDAYINQGTELQRAMAERLEG